MHWKLKCLAFHAFSLPGGAALHRLAQRHITRTYFREVNSDVISSYNFHIQNYKGGVALEIGAGADLLVPLLLRHARAPKIYAYDLSRLATVEQVNHVIRQLRNFCDGDWPEVTDLKGDLISKYNVFYRAPWDARRTGLPDESVDFIYSTSVLEHVPESELRALFAECTRVASANCVMSHNIGYVDHYAHSDSRISYFHFYKYGSRWALYNPPAQYQNRLRHCDFEQLFEKFGLHIAASQRVMAEPDKRVPAVPIHPHFSRYREEDLFAHDGLFVLTKH